MRAKSFYMGIGLVNFFLMPAYGMLFEENNSIFHTFSKQTTTEEPTLKNDNEKESNPNCGLIRKKIREVEKILQGYGKKEDQIPLSEIQRYESYLEDLKNLHTRARKDKKMNAPQELYFIIDKYF